MKADVVIARLEEPDMFLSALLKFTRQKKATE
jgi:hypothetical protein